MIEKLFLLVLYELMTISFVRSQVIEKNIVHYKNAWAVKLSKNDEGVMQQLIIHEGFEIVHQVLNSHVLFQHCNYHVPNWFLL